MLAAGRSFPAVTTVRRASAKTAAAGRTWRSTQGSFPNKNVRGLSSEGTPGTVAGVKAAGVLRVGVDARIRGERQHRPLVWIAVVVRLVCCDFRHRIECVSHKMHTALCAVC